MPNWWSPLMLEQKEMHVNLSTVSVTCMQDLRWLCKTIAYLLHQLLPSVPMLGFGGVSLAGHRTYCQIAWSWSRVSGSLVITAEQLCKTQIDYSCRLLIICLYPNLLKFHSAVVLCEPKLSAVSSKVAVLIPEGSMFCQDTVHSVRFLECSVKTILGLRELTTRQAVEFWS